MELCQFNTWLDGKYKVKRNLHTNVVGDVIVTISALDSVLWYIIKRGVHSIEINNSIQSLFRSYV